MMKKKYNISKKMVLIVLLLAIFGVSTVTFGYFTVQRMGDSGNAVSGRVKKSGPKITYKENSEEGLTLTGAYPMPDELGNAQEKAYVFSIKNEENKDVNAKIIMEVTKNSSLDDSLINISINGTVVTLGALNQEKASSGYKSAYVLKTEKLTPGKSVENTIKIWINENGTADNASTKEWSSSILVIPEFA